MTKNEMYTFISRQNGACIAMSDREGTPDIMPLPGFHFRDGNALCFIVRESDPHVQLLRQNPMACICFQSNLTPFCCVTLNGYVRFNRDADMMRHAWNSTTERFYNGYMNNPDFMVLRFIWHSASFRTARSSGPVF